MTDYLLSAGIDIGTSTTQLIFSKLYVADANNPTLVPRLRITGREILCRSPVYFTPLRCEEEIDAAGVEAILRREYERAGIRPEDLQTGAVIITGETARRRNARQVAHALARLAGSFVVAAAGPELESVLAGKGAGAAQLSRETGRLVANLDIGGGTANICYFDHGEVLDTACLNLGGRLVKVSGGTIRFCSPVLAPVLEQLGLELPVGAPAEPGALAALAERMAELIGEAVGLEAPSDGLLDRCVVGHGITCGRTPEIITFSGGVADCIFRKVEPFAFGDIGPLLGAAIAKSSWFRRVDCRPAGETINATVIGAGNFSTEVSGSTIACENCPLPLKNVPVCAVPLAGPEDLPGLGEAARRKLDRFHGTEPEGGRLAVAFAGLRNPTFPQLEDLAGQLCRAFRPEAEADRFPVLVMETDMGKALGQALRRRLGRAAALLCLDGICCRDGDYLDIGKPVVPGGAVPVVVKTLIFQAERGETQ